MKNPYLPPESKVNRVYRTPIIIPISIVTVIAIHASYIFFYIAGDDVGIFPLAISFEIFLICDVGTTFLILYNKRKIDHFLTKYPIIENKAALEYLKPVARTNMYSALVIFFLLALGSLAGIMSILNHGLAKGVLVAILILLKVGIMKWYIVSEQRVKYIECDDESLNEELNDILQCWMNKPFPNF